MTLAEVGAEVGISVSTLSGIETGHDDPGRATYTALAQFYGVSLDYLEGRSAAPGVGEARDVPQNAEEVALLRGWRALDRAQQETVARLMEVLADTGAPDKPKPNNPTHRRTSLRVNKP